MAKKRSLDIDKLLFDTEIIERLSIKGILLYQVLWGHADDWGGIELDIKNLSLRTGALKMTIKEVEKEIIKLTNGLKKIIPYTIDDKNYGWIKNFFKHQRLNNPAMPTIPLPEWIVYKVNTYPSGKKWAEYTVIPEKIPVDYQYTTSKSDTIPIDTILIDTDTTEKSKFLDFVLLTSKEHQSLIDKLGQGNTNIWIKKLNDYIGAKGIKYKSHYHTICMWVDKDRVVANTGFKKP